MTLQRITTGATPPSLSSAINIFFGAVAELTVEFDCISAIGHQRILKVLIMSSKLIGLVDDARCSIGIFDMKSKSFSEIKKKSENLYAACKQEFVGIYIFSMSAPIATLYFLRR